MLARGNRREPIVLDYDDRRMLLRTLGEMAGRTGIQVGEKNIAGKHTSQIVFNNAALNKVSLFNLAADPAEMNDLADSPDPAVQAIRADLQTRYDAWQASHGSQTPMNSSW